MPLIPVVDTTPLIAPPSVENTITFGGEFGQGPPPTESGTEALARAVAVTTAPSWFERLLLWPEPDTATGTVTYDITTLPVRVADPLETPASDPSIESVGTRAYSAFKDLGRWLMLTDPAIARMVGIKRTTAYTWEREGRQPRPATVRRLMQHHAVVAAVIDRLGEDEGRAWLAAGSPSAIELLLAGHLDVVDERVGDLVFERSVSSPPAGAYLFDDEDDIPPSQLRTRRS